MSGAANQGFSEKSREAAFCGAFVAAEAIEPPRTAIVVGAGHEWSPTGPRIERGQKQRLGWYENQLGEQLAS
jgi:hypothetical protein